MKIRHFLLLVIATGVAAGDVGDASTQVARAAAASQRRQKFDGTTPCRLGMTREEVPALDGKLKFRSPSPRVEIWNDTFVVRRFRGPYASRAPRVKMGAEDRRKDLSWGQSNPAFVRGM